MPKTNPEDDAQEPASGTGDYSATKAPENREHVESKAPSEDPNRRPGGPHGVTVEVGMAGLDRDTVPGLAPVKDGDEDKASTDGSQQPKP